jgi:hypothetical protein
LLDVLDEQFQVSDKKKNVKKNLEETNQKYQELLKDQ